MAQHSSVSRLELFIGPMFSSKTTALLRKITQCAEMGLKVMYINHGLDTRADTAYSTHSTLIQSVNIPGIKCTELSNELYNTLKDYNVIAIDEAQFFTGLVQFVLRLVEDLGKYVLVGGLDGNYKRERIGEILDLIPYSDSVTKLHAYCKKCSNAKVLCEANFTKYIGASVSSTTVIGGAESYLPVCRACYVSTNDSESSSSESEDLYDHYIRNH